MKAIGSFEGRILFETAEASSENLGAALEVLQGCWKSSSLLWMHVNHFPALSGLILGRWLPESGEAINAFSRVGAFSELLVRIEKPGQRWTRRRGGYLIPVTAAPSLVSELASEGMLTLLLEPVSPHSDLYSLTSLCDFFTGKIDIEVVGPGFDASDLLRSDTTPHERFEILPRTEAKQVMGPPNYKIRRLQLIEPDAYRKSVQRRLAKVGARLRNPSFPDEVLEHFDCDKLANEARRYLEENGQTLVLEHLNNYEPIPLGLLDVFLVQLGRLLGAVAQVRWEALSVAGSFLGQQHLVMWDFFPTGDQDTRVLSGIRALP